MKNDTQKIKKVLIVEDEADIRFLLKQYFKKKKLTVIEADSLKEAEKLLENIDQSTLVTLDLNLPDGNGFSFLKKLRDLGKKCKVVICSAYSDYKDEALNLGADEFLSKPIIMSRLEVVLN